MPPTRAASQSDPTVASPLAREARASKIVWEALIPIALIHVLGLALAPFYFSRIGLIVGLIGAYIIAPIGINLTYHRILTHRSLSVPRWLEHTFVVIALLSLEGPPMQWVSVHRLHHRRSDEPEDPHSPRQGLFWAHMGWLFRPQHSPMLATSYARDLASDPFYRWLQGGLRWFGIYAAHVIVLWGAGVLGGWLAWRDIHAATQLGWSILVWGVLVRQIYVWHITWSINSLTHVWGYQSYATKDQSRNNWLLGIFAAGEGWHNNHHHDQASASNWHRFWEFDWTYVLIRCLELAGLATDVKRPRHARQRRDVGAATDA
jgi:fatty-acid desaturase